MEFGRAGASRFSDASSTPDPSARDFEIWLTRTKKYEKFACRLGLEFFVVHDLRFTKT
jgi:hypothetical protein